MSEGLLVGDTGAGVPLPESQSSAGSFSGDDADWDTTPMASPFIPLCELVDLSGTVSGTTTLSCAHASGDALLDYSAPLNPAVLSDGVYALTAFVNPSGSTAGDALGLALLVAASVPVSGSMIRQVLAAGTADAYGEAVLAASVTLRLSAGDVLQVDVYAPGTGIAPNGSAPNGLTVVRLA